MESLYIKIRENRGRFAMKTCDDPTNIYLGRVTYRQIKIDKEMCHLFDLSGNRERLMGMDVFVVNAEHHMEVL